MTTTTTAGTDTGPSMRNKPLDPVGADLTRHAEGAQARRAEPTPCPSGSPWPGSARWATPRSSSSSWPTRSPDASPAPRCSRARAAGLDPTMRLDTWDELDDLTYDRTLLVRPDQPAVHRSRPRRPRPRPGRSRQDTPRHRPGTHRDPPPPHRPRRPRRQAVHPATRRPPGQHPRRRDPHDSPASTSSSSTTSPCRPLDATQTNDFYEIVVERHRRASTIVTSNREPAEWLTMTSDALLAQSAVDRLTSGAHTLIIEGPSYRQRTPHRRATVDLQDEAK